MKLRYIIPLTAVLLLLNETASAVGVSLDCQIKDPNTQLVRHDFFPGEKVLVQAVLEYPPEAIGKVANFDASTQAANARLKFGRALIKGLGKNFSVPLWSDNIKLRTRAKDDSLTFSRTFTLPTALTRGALTLTITSSVADIGTDSCGVELNILN